MKQIVLKHNTIVQAVASLHRAILLLEKTNNETIQNLLPCLRDSIIKRFQYSANLLWQYLRTYLKDVENIIPKIRGPKNILKACCKVGILTEQETIQAIKMFESQSMIPDAYKEEIAEQIAAAIPDYYTLMVHIIEKTKPE